MIEHPTLAARSRTWKRTAVCSVLAVLATALMAPSAFADPVWHLQSDANSTAAPGSTLQFYVQRINIGDTDATGTQTLTVTLPAGMTGVSAGGGGLFCPDAAGAQEFVCSTSANHAPHQVRILIMRVAVDPGASGVLTALFELEGGGAPDPVTTADTTEITTDPPAFGVAAFDGSVTADPAGTPFTQAGGHPFAISTSIDFHAHTHPSHPIISSLWPVEPAKDVVVDLPPGLVGNPAAVPRCTLADLASDVEHGYKPLCSPASQVGMALVRTNGFGFLSSVLGPLPVYNLVPPADAPARFGFNAVGTVVTLNAKVRSGTDYGLTVDASNTSEGLALIGTSLTFWGTPADPRHDPERACSGRDPPQYASVSGPSCTTDAESVAFLRNPTSCPDPGRGLVTTLRTDSWFDPGDWKTASFVSHEPPGYPLPSDRWGPEIGTTGCARVPFRPELAMTPDMPVRAGAPTGFSFDLTMPQNDDPDGIATGDLKKAVVTLPQGVRVSPSSAHGLAACSEAQIGLASTDDPTCPDASKIGSLTIDTPLLEEQLSGGIYLATPFANRFNSLLAVYIVARGPGLIVKLAGQVTADPDTGQLTATFDDNPQLPFSTLHLEFNGGPTAPLATPRRCGTYTTHAELTSWSGKTVSSDSSFTLTENAKGQPCSSEFTPGFRAGTQNPVAGRSAPFSLRLTRDDEDQELKSLTVDMPEGLLGKIASVDLCSEPAANAGTCAEGSRLGDVIVGAGAGGNPFYITNGRAYITGPTDGAPFGLSIVVPAIAGPFDLGTVVVRAAIHIDKHDATLRVVSDPLPTILQGILLDVRDVRVVINRAGFIVNPTSCAEKRIGGVITSTEGATANVSSRFQVGECANLSLKPRMTLTVGSSGHTSRGASTPFTATLRQSAGQANLRSVRVTLPTTINARLNVINRACTRAEFEAGNCNKARAGTATAVTPLLRDPLRGNAYFVRNGNPLPDLFVALRGQVDFDLIGKVSIPGSKRLATTFDAVPDVPITSFSLKLVSGRQGPVGTAANLCTRRGRTAKAQIDFVGQNGKTRFVDQRLKIRGCGKQGGSKKGAKGATGSREH